MAVRSAAIERTLIGIGSGLLAASLLGAFTAYNRFGVVSDNVADVRSDIGLRDLRERGMRDSLIRVEEQLKCEERLRLVGDKP